MRLLVPALLVLVAACTSEAVATGPDASVVEAGADAYVAPELDAAADALSPLPEASVDGGVVEPACNGALRRADCAALDLPAAYGFSPDCTGNPWLPVDGGVAFRPRGRASCLEWDTVKTGDRLDCCPE